MEADQYSFVNIGGLGRKVDSIVQLKTKKPKSIHHSNEIKVKRHKSIELICFSSTFFFFLSFYICICI